MGIFRRRQKPASLTGHPGDDRLLQMISTKSDIDAPRHWVHYLFFPNEPTARQWAQSIAATGWNIQSVHPSSADDGTWVVVPELHAAVLNSEVIRDAREYFEAIASRIEGADYDGWEASL